jgi:hypothetical protein
MHCARRCRQTLGVRAGHKPEKRCCEYGGKDELLHVTTSLSIGVAGRDTLCGIHGDLRVFDAVEHHGQ